MGGGGGGGGVGGGGGGGGGRGCSLVLLKFFTESVSINGHLPEALRLRLGILWCFRQMIDCERWSQMEVHCIACSHSKCKS